MINTRNIKMFIVCLLSLILCLCAFGCKKEDKKEDEKTATITLTKNELTLQLGEFESLDSYVSEVSGIEEYTILFTSSDNNIAIVNDGVVVAKNGGECEIIVSLAEMKGEAKIKVTVKGLYFDSEDEVVIGKTIRITPHVGALTDRVIYELSDESLATLSAGYLTGVKEGELKITMKCGEYSYTKTINVEPICITDITVESDNMKLKENGTIQLNYTYSPSEATNSVIYKSSDDTIISVNENGLVKGLKKGNASVTIKANDKKGFEKVINFEVVEGGVATVTYDTDYKAKTYLNWGKSVEEVLTKGLNVTDPVYGDITDKYELVGEVNNLVYGDYNVSLKYDDGVNTPIIIERVVSVVWNYKVQFIGHAGSYFGVANSEQAFLYAAKNLHYQAIECDLKRTSDGVFVMSHDDTFGGKTIQNTTFAELSKVVATASRTSGYPATYGMLQAGEGKYSTNICTLDRYLEICKEYGCIAVIELKSCPGVNQNDQSGMQALMNQIEKAGMLDQIIFLGSAYNCLAWTRSHGYSQIPCQYLVNSIDSQTVLDRCNQYNFDISTNVTAEPAYANSEEWIAKYQEAGHKVSVWTFTQYVDYPVVQEWIDKGVDYVTCDWHVMSNLKLPEKGEYKEINKYTVTFKDIDGTVLKEAKVEEGKTAAGPVEPKKDGYKFIGWDKAITNVTEDFTVTAQYDLIEYTLSYDVNFYKEEVTTWANKDAFVSELYTDMYNWFITSGTKSSLGGVTVDGNKVTVVRNGVTVSFSGLADIKAINIYDFEKTLSNYIYKPVTRNSDGSCIIVVDENYFLNSSLYKDKYQEFDKVIYETCVTNYSSYNKTYTPTSAGKIQIFFRFHQWTQGTNISTLNKYFPAAGESLMKRYVISLDPSLNVTMPENTTYTVESDFDLPTPVGNLKFLGWYTDKECTGSPVTKITKGTTGAKIYYAKWEVAE